MNESPETLTKPEAGQTLARPACYAAGDSICLTSYHKDRRPTIICAIGPESCVLTEPRGGYYTWNYADIEPHNAPGERPPTDGVRTRPEA